MERSYENMFACHAIVIDIDCHADLFTEWERDNLIDNFVWRFRNDCVECGDLISPNYIVFTGRGVQLWWFITPVYAPQFKKCILDVSKHFVGIIQNLLNEFQSELEGLDIDVAASTNPIGLFRLPGSTNPIVRKTVRVQHLSDERLDLISYRDEHLPYMPRQQFSVRGTRPVAEFRDQKEWFMQLLDAVQQLRQLRAAPSGSELRNNFIYLFFSIAKSLYPIEVAQKLTREFNSGFHTPLRDQELKSTLSSAVRKAYVIGPKKIIDLLDVTKEEAELIGLTIPSGMCIDTPEKNKKSDRDNKILAMYLDGAKKNDIADALGISRKTVSSVLGSLDAEKLLIAKTKLLADSGMKSSEIARQMHCTSRTIRNRLAAASAMDPAEIEKAEKMGKKCLYIGCTLAPIPRQEEQGGQGESAAAQGIALTRIEKLILKCLRHASKSEGSLCLSESMLRERVTATRKKVKPNEIDAACESLIEAEQVKRYCNTAGECLFYLPENNELETATTEAILKLLKAEKTSPISYHEINWLLDLYELDKQMTLSCEQRDAIISALTAPMSVITGGPGTGKTAVTDAICSLIQYHDSDIKVRLCAPTGKAAVHLTETTGYTATTIHSLLSSRSVKCDYMIVDEMSMVSIELFVALIQKLPPSVRLIMVGDPDQLPCIGSGNILRDLIASGRVPTVKLQSVFRQGENSGIARFATSLSSHRNLDMALSVIGDSLTDDISLQCADRPNDSVVSSVSDIVTNLINVHGVQAADIQILAPTKECVDRVNLGLRNLLNCTEYGQVSTDSGHLMPGDRVIYCRNDYARGLFNGSTGVVRAVDIQYVTVEYTGHHIVQHRPNEVDEKRLIRAYALTIHKAQGSEYPVVIIPIYESMDRVLTRNLIYTAVTRSKKKCVLVGSKTALEHALQRTIENTHCSGLTARLIKDM